MTEQKQRKLLHPLTPEEALDLVDFELVEGEWRVKHDKCNVKCNVYSNVGGDVIGNVGGDVIGNVGGDVMAKFGAISKPISGAPSKDANGNLLKPPKKNLSAWLKKVSTQKAYSKQSINWRTAND